LPPLSPLDAQSVSFYSSDMPSPPGPLGIATAASTEQAILIYNCSPWPMTSLTVNGQSALNEDLPGTAGAVAPPATIEASGPSATIGVSWNNSLVWTQTIALPPPNPPPICSLWCFFDGYTFTVNGIVRGTYWQRQAILARSLSEL
jgi:hypothetical protein